MNPYQNVSVIVSARFDGLGMHVSLLDFPKFTLFFFSISADEPSVCLILFNLAFIHKFRRKANKHR